MQDQQTRTEIRPLISVCIANYNGENIIGAAIESVLNQQTTSEIEILIHDDASTDNSCEYIKSHYPDIKLIESKANVGYCVSNNRLAQYSRGQYLLFLNNDANLFPDAVQQLTDMAIALAKPSILGLPQYDMDTSDLIDRGSLYDCFLNPVPNMSPDRTQVGMIMGACLWIPRNIWDEIGGFPEYFESLAEDMFLCLSAITRGYNVQVSDKSGYKHWIGNSFGGGKLIINRMDTTIRRRRLSERNKSYCMVIFYPGSLFYILFPAHLISLFLEGIILSLVKLNFRIFTDIYLFAFASLWKNRKYLMEQRSLQQSCRHISVFKFLKNFVFIPHKLNMLLKHGLPTLR